jgi:hypothetical protein
MCAIYRLAGHVHIPEKHRPWEETLPSGAVYRFAPGWGEKLVLNTLASARGIIQVPSYA